MDATAIQLAFFQHIKSLLPQHMSLVDAIADILSISNDSAYRRIRGEKPMTIEEIQKLATHFRISLDQFLHLKTDSFIFSGRLANAQDHIFEKWMETVLQHLQFAATFQKKHVTYLAKDIPLMEQLMVPELAAFKSFFWRKSILHYDEMRGAKFSLQHVDERHIELSRKITEVYNQIGSSDIWNIESINSTIRQIEFYREAGIFETEDDIAGLYKSVFKLIDHLEKQAELGLKFKIDEQPRSNAAPYYLYNNELILGDNTLLFELDHMKICFLNHSVINYVSTHDELFNQYMYNTLQNLIKKSTPLSVSSEKERTLFFNRVRDKMKLTARL